MLLTLEATVDICTLMKVAPHSAATARAKELLPVPGGPKRSTPCTVDDHAL